MRRGRKWFLCKLPEEKFSLFGLLPSSNKNGNHLELVGVDPLSNKELIISPYGENHLDNYLGTKAMNHRISQLADEVYHRCSQYPNYLAYRVYDKSGNIVGSGGCNPKVGLSPSSIKMVNQDVIPFTNAPMF